MVMWKHFAVLPGRLAIVVQLGLSAVEIVLAEPVAGTGRLDVVC